MTSASVTEREPATAAEQKLEWLVCSESVAYFVHNHVQIKQGKAWAPFRLWPEQVRALRLIESERRLVVLKARQLGLTWLCLSYLLWLMLFRSEATVSLFSLRDPEAVDLLDKRLKRMHARLPRYLRADGIVTDDKHVWELSQGSVARAFPTSAGDSYTARCALIDEADLVADLEDTLGRVEPTVDHPEGQLILVSRSDKSEPKSHFKAIYREAKKGANGWTPLFLAWNARPDRTAAWYAQKRAAIESSTGALDMLHEQYPATDSEALAPASLDKRYPAAWLSPCYEEAAPLKDAPGAPAYPELKVYALPAPGRRYVIGCDPAEGLPGGDASVAEVLDRETGEEVAALAGQLEPKRAFPEAIAALAAYYNGADVLVLRNNHGHAVIGALEAAKVPLLLGKDGRPGFVESLLGRTVLCDTAADAFKNGETRVHSFATKQELDSIERNTLKAPKGQHDDRADAYAAALYARTLEPPTPPRFGVFTL